MSHEENPIYANAHAFEHGLDFGKFIELLTRDCYIVLGYEKAGFMLAVTLEQDGQFVVTLIIDDGSSFVMQVQHIQTFRHAKECFKYVTTVYNPASLRWLSLNELEDVREKAKPLDPFTEFLSHVAVHGNYTRSDH